jgi:hypothetical protein
MSDAESPARLSPEHTVTVDDIRELTGAATPHFAQQIRARVVRLIEGLPPDNPARIEGERAIARLDRIAREGQAAGRLPEHEQPLPSLKLGPNRSG